MRTKPFLPPLPTVALALLLVACGGAPAPSGDAPPLALEDLDGDRVELGELLGEGPVLVDFWATWCAPCRRAMPRYQELVERYGDRGFRVVAVSQDNPGQAGRVRRYMEGAGYDFTVLLDPGRRAGQDWGVSTLPHSFLLDRRGNVVEQHRGFADGDERALEARVQELLAAG